MSPTEVSGCVFGGRSTGEIWEVTGGEVRSGERDIFGTHLVPTAFRPIPERMSTISSHSYENHAKAFSRVVWV
jgi:hypothetical protein